MHAKRVHILDCDLGALTVLLIGISAVSLLDDAKGRAWPAVGPVGHRAKTFIVFELAARGQTDSRS